MTFFNLVAAELPSVYKELTNVGGGGGGSASLLITDAQEKPFESQILFDFCPQGKRHGADLEQLSGGEQTIAALSFVFALAKVKKPPMVLLDEVDAFLDVENVNLLANFLKRQHSLSNAQSQTLVTTHKECLAEQTQSLIGVCLLK